MKFTAIKAAVAVCLLVPVMAMAKTEDVKPVSTTFSYSFSDMTGTDVNIGKNYTKGFLSFQASWQDLLSGFGDGKKVESQATSLSWTLTSANGKTLPEHGILSDLVGKPNNGLIVLDESLLKKGEYKLTLSGTWMGSATGIKKDFEYEGPQVHIGEHGTFSTVSPVPEPESYAMFLAGLGLMGTIALRRKKADAS